MANSEVVQTDLAAALFGERDQGHQVEILNGACGLIELHRKLVHARLLGRGETRGDLRGPGVQDQFRPGRSAAYDWRARDASGELYFPAGAAERRQKSEHRVSDVRRSR